ncbi:acyltransferase family protein [Flavobacterium sp. Sd200]|uniref:acyltransferase n=1 Tax=Flavobacterium sp. Sd200 TaxID=2692211 RepID=UPI001369EFD8|nr:acyltransferase family protein [Flavobacterium sp. Sd200]MXN89611.1 acyltransferase family protein [Flavobacterium sp. Sd200]
MDTTRPKEKEREYWLDLLRFIAIFMVICIHCADPFNISPEARANPEYNFWGSLYGAFLRPCVPLFVMITGALLLPIKENTGAFYKKRLSRILIPFLIWSILYNCYPLLTGMLGLDPAVVSETFAYAGPHPSQSLEDTIARLVAIIVSFNAYTVHLWYIFMLAGLYLYMPYLTAWIEKADRFQYKIYGAFWAATLFLPYAFRFTAPDILGRSAWNSFDTFYYFAGFNGYLFLGYCVKKYPLALNTATRYILCAALFSTGYLITYLGFRYMTANPGSTENDVELFFLYCSPQVALMTLAVILFIKPVKIRSKTVRKYLARTTQYGLGIYLCHYFVVGLGYAISQKLSIPVSVRIPFTALVVFAISWIVVHLFYKATPRYARWIFG